MGDYSNDTERLRAENEQRRTGRAIRPHGSPDFLELMAGVQVIGECIGKRYAHVLQEVRARLSRPVGLSVPRD